MLSLTFLAVCLSLWTSVKMAVTCGCCDGPVTFPHPAWCMCVPLLVGLAGADCVSELESRILWGRAFIVACGEKKKKKVNSVEMLVRSIYVIIDIEFSPTSSCSQSRARINAKRKFVLIYTFWECISIVLSMACLKMALFCIKFWVKSFETLSMYVLMWGVDASPIYQKFWKPVGKNLQRKT